MASTATALAEALAADLSMAFAPEFTAQRVYSPEVELAEAEGLKVYVLAAGATRRRAAFDTEETTYTMNVLVRQKLERYTDPEDADDLVALLEDIADRLVGRTLSDGEYAYTCASAVVGTDSGIIDLDLWREQGIFHGVVASEWQVIA